MSPVGSDHSNDHSVGVTAISLFAALKTIPLTAKDNCTYRKAGYAEAQLDVSLYIGDNANAIPWGTTIIDLDVYPAPDLVIEIANTSLSDDQGTKRLLYEDLGVKEYWVFDVKNVRVLAFEVINQGSFRITASKVLPGLQISLIQEALQRTRQMTQSEVIAWLMSEVGRSQIAPLTPTITFSKTPLVFIQTPISCIQTPFVFIQTSIPFVLTPFL